MHALIEQVSDYFWGAWRYRWLMLALGWLFSVAGWVYVSNIPYQYEATARIYVDTNSILRPLLRGLTVQPDLSQRTALVSKTLLSRPNLEKLIRMTDLDLQINSEQQKEELFGNLTRSISLTGDRRNPSLYTATYLHPERDTAKLLVQSLITVFTESMLGNKRTDTDDAQLFIQKQIEDYEVRLKEAEQRLVQFKQQNAAALSGEVGTYYGRLQELKNSAGEVRLHLAEMENRRDELVRQLEDEEELSSEFFDEAESPGVYTPYDSRIQSLQEKLDTLSLRYTNRHPEMIQVRSMISELEAKKRRELSRSGSAATSPELINNPVYQQKQAMLAATEATIAELRVRADEYDRRTEELEAKVEEIPEVEAQLMQLNRDYGAISSHHKKLLQSRESAYMSEDMEEGGSGVSFRVIDPPFVPIKPTVPNRLLLNTGVFLAAIGMSFGVAILLSLLNPVIFNQTTLGKMTGLPVLGSVTNIASPEQRRIALVSSITYASLTVFLVGTFFALNFLQGALSV